jgi:hypothetical protein
MQAERTLGFCTCSGWRRIELFLRVIKLICFNIEDEKYVPQKVHERKTAFYNLKQGKETDQAYQISQQPQMDLMQTQFQMFQTMMSAFIPSAQNNTSNMTSFPHVNNC